MALLEPERCDLLEAIDILADYLNEQTSSKLLPLFSFSAEDLSSARVATATKRKADWETALEVIILAIYCLKSISVTL